MENGNRYYQLKEKRCMLCNSRFGEGNKRLQIHHVDKNRNNNKELNLLIVCKKCHILIHNPSSWYVSSVLNMWNNGCSAVKIANTFNVCRQRIYQILKKEINCETNT